MVDAACALFEQLPDPDIPFVAEGLACAWPAIKFWNLSYLFEKVSCTLKFRLGRKKSEDLQWETTCPHVYATINQFQHWIEGKCQVGNPFREYPIDSWWAYADYIYMVQSGLMCHLIKDLHFHSSFPFLSEDISPTFWLGSSKSQTICHYDTYGVNLVVQVQGCKRWVLFPPSDSPYLYSTRIPLEESTVFSKINFPQLDCTKYPLLSQTSPQFVILHPGDVLFVPRNWWHFVESCTESEYTCSVNLWIDQPHLDNEVRFREALTQLVGFTLLSNCSSLDHRIALHVSEQHLYESDIWLSEIIRLLIQLKKYLPTNLPKKANAKEFHSCGTLWKRLKSKSIKDLFEVKSDVGCSSSTPLSFKNLTVENIIDSFLQPDVIDLVAKHIERNLS